MEEEKKSGEKEGKKTYRGIIIYCVFLLYQGIENETINDAH